jgi:hypothetical protein
MLALRPISKAPWFEIHGQVERHTLPLERDILAVGVRFFKSDSWAVVADYRTKKSGELSRYTLAVGVSYTNLVVQSLSEARSVVVADNAKNSIERKAKAEVLRSLRNTLENGKNGEQNDAYTKKGRYQEVAAGVTLFDDGTFELKGIVISRKVLEVGVHKKVKSYPLTIAKDAIRKQLSLAKWRTLCLDSGALDSLRAGHKEIEVA